MFSGAWLFKFKVGQGAGTESLVGKRYGIPIFLDRSDEQILDDVPMYVG